MCSWKAARTWVRHSSRDRSNSSSRRGSSNRRGNSSRRDDSSRRRRFHPRQPLHHNATGSPVHVASAVGQGAVGGATAGQAGAPQQDKVSTAQNNNHNNRNNYGYYHWSGYEPDGYGGYYSDPYPLQDNYYSGGDEHYGDNNYYDQYGYGYNDQYGQYGYDQYGYNQYGHRGYSSYSHQGSGACANALQYSPSWGG